MIRRPPRSTLFPTRRSSDLDPVRLEWAGARARGGAIEGAVIHVDRFGNLVTSLSADAIAEPRSEEHTSELQSQSNLVCRLLLEKKKKEEDTYKNNGDVNSRA